MLHFLSNGQSAFESVKQELPRIGYRIQKCNMDIVLGST